MSAKKASRRGKKTAKAKGAAAARPSPSKQERRGRVGTVALRPVPLYEFTAGEVAGYVRLEDPGRGIEFARASGGRSLPGVCREVLSLRHYLASGNGGLLAPREEAACEGKVEKQGVLFRYDKVRGWPVSATARYELLKEGGVDAVFQFGFAKGLREFEAGVETVMAEGASEVRVHAGGVWVRAGAQRAVQQFFPRNAGAAELIADGRWKGLEMAGIGVVVERRGYDYPILVVREGEAPWALAFMALTEECSSMWVNSAERTVGLGLVGADVKAKGTATCRVRALLCEAEKLEAVLPYYREFVQEARAARRR